MKKYQLYLPLELIDAIEREAAVRGAAARARVPTASVIRDLLERGIESSARERSTVGG
jgi:hypothetical protein